MLRYPAEVDFLELFEAEPVVTTGERWPYCEHTYEVQRDGALLRLKVAPADGSLYLSLASGEAPLVELTVGGIREWCITASGARQYLEVRFAEHSPLHALVVQLRPALKVSWGADALP